MKALILNLADQTERMALQRAQMAHFALDFERIEAVTPATLSRPTGDPYWMRWQRPMRDTEKAVLESHQRAWQFVVETGEPHLILEDDALLAEGAAELLASVEKSAAIDHLTLEARGRKKLLGAQLDELPVRRLYQDRTGAAAYVLWPSGAEKLLAHTAHAGALADAAICSAYSLRSYQADPALAIQIDRCEIYGVTAPFVVTSTIDVERKPDRLAGLAWHQRAGFRLRRFAAQLRMGLRQLANAHRASRIAVPVASNWPEFRSPDFR
ncbi:MAG: glycosyl transferase family 25 [Hyphomicrobiales bacterium]|nr:MAG: glycosyl transferase family 25 [Hyphomicrobiales bacterium]